GQYHPELAFDDLRCLDNHIPRARAGRPRSPLAQRAWLFSGLAVFVLNPADKWEEGNENKLDEDDGLDDRSRNRIIGGRPSAEPTTGDRDRRTMRPHRPDANRGRQLVSGIPRLRQPGEREGWGRGLQN